MTNLMKENIPGGGGGEHATGVTLGAQPITKFWPHFCEWNI